MAKQSSHDISNSNDTIGIEALNPEVADAIKNLKPSQQNIVIRSILATKQESFSGPLPHPDILSGYEDVQEGFAERIVSMAEKQQAHRIDCEKKMISGTISESKRGQWMGFSIAVLFLGAAIALGVLGHDWLAGVLGGGTLVSLVMVFLKNRPASQPNQ